MYLINAVQQQGQGSLGHSDVTVISPSHDVFRCYTIIAGLVSDSFTLWIGMAVVFPVSVITGVPFTAFMICLCLRRWVSLRESVCREVLPLIQLFPKLLFTCSPVIVHKHTMLFFCAQRIGPPNLWPISVDLLVTFCPTYSLFWQVDVFVTESKSQKTVPRRIVRDRSETATSLISWNPSIWVIVSKEVNSTKIFVRRWRKEQKRL